MHWLLLTVWLNIHTGEIERVDPPVPVDPKECLQLKLPELPKDGLVPYHVCRQVDEAGKPIPEDKIDPSKPEAPKERV